MLLQLVFNGVAVGVVVERIIVVIVIVIRSNVGTKGIIGMNSLQKFDFVGCVGMVVRNAPNVMNSHEYRIISTHDIQEHCLRKGRI